MKCNFKKSNIFIFAFLFLNIAFATDTKPIEIKTINGCKFTYFVGRDKKAFEIQNENISTWNGACVHGYLDGYGHFELKQKDGDYSITQNVTYKKGRENGKGNEVKYLSNGVRIEYEGEFFDGHWKSGVAAFYKNNELQYKITGNFISGQIDGLGTYTLANGGKWTGNFTNGVMNGAGEVTRLDGITDWINYENGKIPDVGVGDGSKDHYYCAERGLRPGTSYYAKCRNFYSVKMDERKRMEDYINRSNKIMDDALDRVNEIEKRYR